MSEFMGLIRGVYDAKADGFLPGQRARARLAAPHWRLAPTGAAQRAVCGRCFRTLHCLATVLPRGRRLAPALPCPLRGLASPGAAAPAGGGAGGARRRHVQQQAGWRMPPSCALSQMVPACSLGAAARCACQGQGESQNLAWLHQGPERRFLAASSRRTASTLAPRPCHCPAPPPQPRRRRLAALVHDAPRPRHPHL